MNGPWFQRVRPNPEASLRLFCIPYAGAGASVYRAFAHEASRDIEIVAIQLPGHESRITEPLVDSVHELVDALHGEARSMLDRPYAIFGHSMGALIAYEWTARIAEEGMRFPVCAVVSGRPAAHIPRRLGPFHALPDAELVAVLQSRYHALPKVIVDTPELLDLYLRVFRNDFRAVEQYRPFTRSRVPVPIVAIGGDQDNLAEPWEIEQWRDCTSSHFRSHYFPGNHLFLHEYRKAILDLVREAVEAFGGLPS